MPEADDFDPESYDKYIGAQVMLPKTDQYLLGTITGRKQDLHGNPIGKSNTNPIFDTRVYHVKFPDGHTEEFSANVIAECLYSKIGDEGRQHLLLDEIIDYDVSTDAHDENDLFPISHNGNLHPRQTRKGWCLCVRWKDGSTSWEPLKDLKEAFPIQVAEFGISQGLDNRLAF